MRSQHLPRSRHLRVVTPLLCVLAAIGCDDAFIEAPANGAGGAATGGSMSAPSAGGTGGASMGGMSAGGGPVVGGNGGGGAAAGGAGGGGGGGATPVGTWFDSATAYCSDGTMTVADCSVAPAVQDGQFIGPQPSYTILNGEVVDSLTNLRFSLVENPSEFWPVAADYCTNLGEGGFNDWRLPTWIEMVSLVDYGRGEDQSQSALPLTYLFYWVLHESPNPAHPQGDHWVMITGGEIYPDFNNTNVAATRCVRGPRLEPVFTSVGGGKHHEGLAGLTWDLNLNAMEVPWTAALASCPLGSRLPTVKEAILMLHPNAPNIAGQFWTSTPSGDTARPWLIDLTSRRTTLLTAPENHRVICVAPDP